MTGFFMLLVELSSLHHPASLSLNLCRSLLSSLPLSRVCSNEVSLSFLRYCTNKQKIANTVPCAPCDRHTEKRSRAV